MSDKASEQKPKTNAEKLESLCKNWDNHAKAIDPDKGSFRGSAEEFAAFESTADSYGECSLQLRILIKELE